MSAFQRQFGALLGVAATALCTAASQRVGTVRAVATPPTFSKDVAPIIYARCGNCHRPNGPAPFSLLTYSDARQHATQIAMVTATRYMPPWKNEPGYGDFIGQQPLSDAEIDILQRWVSGGASEGNRRDLPPMPAWIDGWQLGKPDLVVTLPRPYLLRAEGADVSRIFVFPLPTDSTRYVRGFEFRPGNSKVVHHANIRIDRTTASRELDEQDAEPGYEGVRLHSAVYPDGPLSRVDTGTDRSPAAKRPFVDSPSRDRSRCGNASTAEYRRALALKPEYAPAENNLGNVLVMQGKPDEALHHFQEAVRIDPRNAEAHYNLGSVARGRGDWPEALGQFRAAIALEPDSVPALVGLAWLLASAPDAMLRHPDEAIRLAEHMADVTERRDAAVLDLLAAAYAAAGEFDRAVTTAQAALDLKPPDPVAATMRTRQELYKQRRPYVAP